MVLSYFKQLANALILSAMTAYPVFAAEQVNFAASSKYYGKEVVLTGELHKPAGTEKFPVVVLMHGCSGLVPAVNSALRTHARFLTDNGFAALILDSFGPRQNNGGWVCEDVGRLSSAQAYRTKDAMDAHKFLANRSDIDAGNIFAMGQSNGGSVAVLIARKGKSAGFRATTAYYPWCGTITSRKLSIPLLILSGELDDWTPPRLCKELGKPENGVTVKTYPDAVHSFDLDIPVRTYLGHKVGGDATATKDSRRMMVEFFKQHMNQ